MLTVGQMRLLYYKNSKFWKGHLDQGIFLFNDSR